MFGSISGGPRDFLTRNVHDPTINAFSGHTLAVALEMTPETYAHWKDLTSLIADLQDGAKLKEAEVKALEAKAKILEKSGIQIQSSDTSWLSKLAP